MAEEKVTYMVLNADLQCSKCHKKVKKVLSKIPQVRDQVYDEKTNKVLITVVCCSPEKIRDKICYKGGGSIKSIEIKKPEKPKPAAEDKKKKDQETKKATPTKEKEAPAKPTKAAEEKSAKPNPDKPKQHQNPVQTSIPMYYPQQMMMPMPMGGPGYATGVPAGHFGRGGVAHFDGYYGRPVYDSWGGYDNDQPGCSIM